MPALTAETVDQFRSLGGERSRPGCCRPLEFGSKAATGGGGHWRPVWAFLAGENEDDLPCVTFKRESEVIVPGEFTGYMVSPLEDDGSVKQQLLGLMARPQLARFGRQKYVESWCVGRIRIAVRSANPVEAVAPVWAETLRAMANLRQGGSGR